MRTRTLPVLTPAQATAWDNATVASGTALETLMDAAGRAVASLLLTRFGAQAARGVLVACGPGNNGGDGWVTARALHALGTPVWVAEARTPDPGPARMARGHAIADGVRTVAIDGPWPALGLAVDALLGTGARGAPRSPMSNLLARIRELQLPVVAIDGPTGLDLATGLHFDPALATIDAAPPPTLTVTFGAPRRGHLMARDAIGDLVVADIGLAVPDPQLPQLVHGDWAAERLARLHADAEKRDRGRVVIFGGDPAMLGAARLCARAAFATGAGLVHVAAPAESLAVLRATEPDVQYAIQDFALPLRIETRQLLTHADAVVIGPGLGKGEEKTSFVLEVLRHATRAVIDADALTALAPARLELAKLAAARQFICTPHLREFRTLFTDLAQGLETAPWEPAELAAGRSACTVLLKGVPTVVAKYGAPLLTVAAGNPGLATGGSGDVLSGIIGTLLAQDLALPEAGAVGAQALGEAADIAARRVTARAMRPMDVVAALPDVWTMWDRRREHAPAHAPVLLELPVPRTV